MKPVFFISFLLLFSLAAFSQSISTKKPKADLIPDAEMVKMQNNWYQSQAELWQEIIAVDKSDANAWFNYYQAIRYSYYTNSSKELSAVQQAQLNIIIEEMEQKVAKSFEYNYLKYVNSEQNPDYFKFLEKAYTLEPDNADTYDDFIAYYEVIGNTQKKSEFVLKYDKSKYFSELVLSYNYNVLMSLEKNAILFTNGTLDTYPLWIEQQSTRSDVTILNRDLLKNKEYLKSKFDSCGLIGDSAFAYIDNPSEFFYYITSKNPDKNIYFSLAIPSEFLKKISNHLYSTGLALKYKNTDFDNVEFVKNNWKLFKLDALNNGSNASFESSDKKLNLNYLVPIAVLYRNYIENSDETEAKKIYELALKIASDAGKKDFVEAYFKKISNK